MLERQAMRAGPLHVQLRLAPCLRLGTKSCVTSKRAVHRENRRSVKNGDAPFPAGREAVRMFLRGSFPCVFFLAINVDRPEQYAELLRNLQAAYRRCCSRKGRFLALSARRLPSSQSLPTTFPKGVCER